MRDRILTEQVVVRVSPSMLAALRRDAEIHGRTVAQSIRFILAGVVEDAT